METIWYPYRATLCPRHQTRLQELVFDLPGLALLDLALLGLASISLIFLSSYSFHLEMKIPPCLCIFEYVLVFLIGTPSSFASSFRRKLRLGIFNNTETVKTLGTLRYRIRQACTLGGQR